MISPSSSTTFRVQQRFLDFSISNEGGQKSLKVRRVWDIRETLDFSVNLHWKWKNLGISSLLGLVHKLEIRLPEPKIVFTPSWFLQLLLFNKKIIAIPTGMAMGFAIPHAIGSGHLSLPKVISP